MESSFGSLFDNVPEKLRDELTEVIAEGKNVRVERIVSDGHSSPEGFWYDQELDELVVVVAGSAEIVFADSQEPLKLLPGQYVNIPAHVKHRVGWTDKNQKTIWLAVFYQS
jgi:cupin 2 domain-containing protein